MSRSKQTYFLHDFEGCGKEKINRSVGGLDLRGG